MKKSLRALNAAAHTQAQTSEPALSPPLVAAIADCYEVFSHYRTPPYPLDVCTGCCVDPEVEVELRRLPLRQLTCRQLYAYNDTAKSAVQSADELGYFLPRLLELIAQGEEVHHSTELYLDRLGRCPREDFSPTQWQAVQAFAQALFAECLARYPWERGVQWVGYTLFDVLLMFHIGGLDIQPLLVLWQRTDTPQATLQYTHATWFDYWKHGCTSNAFADDQPEYRDRIDAWLRDEDHRVLFARRLMALDPARIPGLGEWHCSAYLTPEQMIQSLIDRMTLDLSNDALRQLFND